MYTQHYALYQMSHIPALTSASHLLYSIRLQTEAYRSRPRPLEQKKGRVKRDLHPPAAGFTESFWDSIDKFQLS